ncbi:MAG: ROK family protein [Dehalococcoidales bacterium]
MKEKNGDTSLTLGIDLGGTKLEVVLTDRAGEIVTSNRLPTDSHRGAEAVIADIVKGVNLCLDEAGKPATALGVGTAGQIEKETGLVRLSPNLGWQNVPLKTKLEQALDIPVMVTNDVRAVTYGEWQYGAGKGIDDIACVFVGTGIGGGIVIDGKLLEGCTNSGGELGHLTIMVDGRKCTCRNRGCYEAYAGGWAIAERAQEAAQADPEAGRALIELAGNPDRISAVTVTEAYNKGDALAGVIVKETVRYLAAGLVSIINAFNPRLVVLGGGVIQGMPEYLPMTEEIVRRDALESALEGISIVAPALGGKAGAIGAAALARDGLLK